MPSRIKTRTNSTKALKPWRIVIPNAERNGEPLAFIAADRKAMMREREKERHGKPSMDAAAVHRRVELAVRRDDAMPPYPKAARRAPVIDRNDRYPWAEIVAAKKDGRKLIPRSRADHWR